MSTNSLTTRVSRGVLAPGMRLGLAVVVMGILWLVVLPRVAVLPAVRARIERNEAAGIDPAAKFYTELPAMPRLLKQVRGDLAAATPESAAAEPF